MDAISRYGKWAIILSLIICTIISPAWNCNTGAQEPSHPKDGGSSTSTPPEGEGVKVEFDTGVVSLSLKESILFAIRNNFDVEIARLDPKIGDLDITVEKSRFDPVFKVSGEVAQKERPLFRSTLRTTDADTNFFKSTVERLFETGGTLSVGYGFDYSGRQTFQLAGSDFTVSSPGRYTSFVEATLTQPLLKGGWFFYNLSPVYIARNNKQISVLQFKNTIIDVVDKVQEAYWNLVMAIEDLRVAKKSLERAEDLLEKNKLQVEAGMLTPIDVLEAESGVASREEAVISAENEIKNKEDELKQVINLSDGSILSGASIFPVDTPVLGDKEADMSDSIRIALQNRPDLLETVKEVENAKISQKQKKISLFPQLDLNGTYRYDGVGDTLGDSNDFLTSTYANSKSIGLSLEVPIGLRSARSEYKKAKLETLQAEIGVKKTEQQVVVDVREAVRQINTNIKRVYSTRKARELAERKLDAEEKKFNVGKTTSHEILRAQEDLAIAEGNETKALIDYQISLGNLDVVTATVLEDNNIHIEE